MVSVHDADLSISDLSLTDLQLMSSKNPDADKISSLFTSFADPDLTTGIVSLFYFRLFILLDVIPLSDSEKLMVLSDGFCNDILLSAYSDLGIPLDQPYKMGYVTPSVSYLFNLFHYNSYLFSSKVKLSLRYNARLYLPLLVILLSLPTWINWVTFLAFMRLTALSTLYLVL